MSRKTPRPAAGLPCPANSKFKSSDPMKKDDDTRCSIEQNLNLPTDERSVVTPTAICVVSRLNPDALALPHSSRLSVPASFSSSIPNSRIEDVRAPTSSLVKTIPSSFEGSHSSGSLSDTSSITTLRRNPLPPGGPRLLMPPTFTVGPMDDGIVVYLRVAPPANGSLPKAMLYLWIDIANLNEQTINLTGIKVSFTGGNQPPRQFDRVAEIGKSNAGSSTRVYLRTSQAMLLENPPFPTAVKVDLIFKEFPQPIETNLFTLGPRAVSYNFFTRDDGTTTFGKYIGLKGAHADTYDEGGTQVFAQDTLAYGWIGDLFNRKISEVRIPKSTKNTDYFLYGRPLYAMGSGEVVEADDSNMDNPEKGVRLFLRRPGDGDNTVFETFNDIDAACERCAINKVPNTNVNVYSNRILIAVARKQSNQLMLTLLEQDNKALTIKKLAQIWTAIPAHKVSVLYFPSGVLAVTATSVVNLFANANLTLWSTPVNAAIVQLDQVSLPNVRSAIKMLRVVVESAGMLLTVSKADLNNETLTMTLWSLSGNKFTPQATHTFGTVLSFDVGLITGARFFTVVQTPVVGFFRVIGWEIVVGPSATTFVKLGEDLIGGATEASAVNVENEDVKSPFGVAVVRTNKNVNFHVYRMEDDGTVIRMLDPYVGTTQASMIKAVNFKKKTVAVLSRQSGRLHVTTMDLKINSGPTVDPQVHAELDTTETTDYFCAAELKTPQTTLVSVIRKNDGFAKVILWQYSDNNVMRIRYGNEIVTYAHLKAGSIPPGLKPPADNVSIPVNANTPVGEMGNSGSGGGPHMHIHVGRILDKYLNFSISQLRQLYQQGVDPTEVRPLQFHGVKSLRMSDLVEFGDNDFHTMDKEGSYGETCAVLPNPQPVKFPKFP